LAEKTGKIEEKDDSYFSCQLLLTITYHQIMQSQNPSAQKSKPILCRDSEKFSSNEQTLTKLKLAVHFVSQTAITSEPWLKLKKTSAVVP
jgi:hypothetical protein